MKSLFSKRKNYVIAFISVSLLCIIYYCYNPFIYQTNDDVFIKNLLSGLETGEPISHVILLNYLLSSFLSLLYRINASIPWYGLLLILSHLTCMSFMLEKILNRTHKNKRKVSIILLFIIVCFFVWMPLVAVIQYTSTAAVLAGTAIFLYLVSGRITFKIICLILLSFCLRDKVLYMSIPFALTGFLIVWLQEEHPFAKNMVLQKIKEIALVLAVVGVAFVSQFVAYSQEPWSDLKEYHTAREKIFDYSMIPDYNENIAFYDELEISFEAYNALVKSYCIVFEENFNNSTFAEIVEEAEDHEANREFNAEQGSNPEVRINKVDQLIQAIETYIIWNFQSRNLLLVALVMCTVYLFLIGIFDKNNRINALFSFGAVVVLRNILWIYFFFEERYPTRLTDALLALELLLYLGVLFKLKIKAKDFQRFSVLIFAVATILMSSVFFYLGFRVTANIKRDSVVRLSLSASYSELKEYCKANEDNFYYIYIQLIGSWNFTEKILVFKEEPFVNHALTGGWLPNTPWYDDKYELMGIDHTAASLLNENVYLISENTHVDNNLVIEEYLLSLYPDASFEVVANLPTSHGTIYEIIKLNKIK